MMLGGKRTPEGLSLNVSREDDSVYDDGYLRVEHGKIFLIPCLPARKERRSITADIQLPHRSRLTIPKSHTGGQKPCR
jgi:hypothetical protein